MCCWSKIPAAEAEAAKSRREKVCRVLTHASAVVRRSVQVFNMREVCVLAAKRPEYCRGIRV